MDAITAITATTAGCALRSAASRFGAAPALVATATGGDLRRWSFSQLLGDTEAAARGLLERFSPGERMAIWAPNVAECYLAHLACGLAGLVAVPVPTGLTPGELRAILFRAGVAGIAHVAAFRRVDMAGAVAAVAPQLPSLREVVDLGAWDALVSAAPSSAALPEVSPGSPVLIPFSSGTTGAPKGVVLHHNGVMNASRLAAERAEVGSGDRWLNFMPLSYSAGCALFVPGALQAGACHILADFEPAAVLGLAEAEAASVLMCGATMARMIADQPGAAASLKTLSNLAFGGAPAPVELCRRLEAEWRVTITTQYGLTESGGVVTQTRPSDPDEARLATVGDPLPGLEVAIIEPGSSRHVEAGDEGEICVRGYQVMSGYLDDPQATARAIDPGGWLPRNFKKWGEDEIATTQRHKTERSAPLSRCELAIERPPIVGREDPAAPGKHTWSRCVIGLGSGEWPPPARRVATPGQALTAVSNVDGLGSCSWSERQPSPMSVAVDHRSVAR